MKTTRTVLAAAAVVLALTLWLLYATRTIVPAIDYDEKIKASGMTLACMNAMRQAKEERGITIDEASDINLTGVIGPDYSAITTTLGNLEAKRTSTNPNMAAVIVDMFNELGLKKGDKIAVNFSGSFPAMNMAVVNAAEVLGLDPFIISSFGSSTHGANDPEFTWPDMEAELFSEGLIGYRSGLFSTGGIRDIGAGMPEEIKDEITDRCIRLGYTFFYNDDFHDNIMERYDIYRGYGDIRCFVNVGGNDVSFGDSQIIVHADGGILTELPERDDSTGLVQLFLKDSIPVIHLLNIRSLAARYGLPVDPVPLPAVGEGGVYFTCHYHKAIAVAGVILAVIILFLGRSVFEREKKKGGRISRDA